MLDTRLHPNPWNCQANPARMLPTPCTTAVHVRHCNHHIRTTAVHVRHCPCKHRLSTYAVSSQNSGERLFSDGELTMIDCRVTGVRWLRRGLTDVRGCDGRGRPSYVRGVTDVDVRRTCGGVTDVDVRCTGGGVTDVDVRCTGGGVTDVDVRRTCGGVTDVDVRRTGGGVTDVDVRCTGGGVTDVDVRRTCGGCDGRGRPSYGQGRGRPSYSPSYTPPCVRVLISRGLAGRGRVAGCRQRVPV